MMPIAQVLILLVAALALFLGIWRVVHAELRSLRDDLGARIDRINDRFDRHLGGGQALLLVDAAEAEAAQEVLGEAGQPA